MGTIEEVEGSSPWYISLEIKKNQIIRFKIDTKADITVILRAIFHILRKFPLRNTTKCLFGPGQKEINLLRSFTDTISSDSRSVQENVYVVRGLTRCFFRAINNKKMELVKRVNEVFTHETVKQNFPKLFEGLQSRQMTLV